MKGNQRRAVAIAKKIFGEIRIEAGRTEKEVADWIKGRLAELGTKPAFRIIVASGARATKPHGYATNKKIKTGELVVVDFGALYQGLRSDITRTFVIGKPTAKQKKVLAIVRKAQQKAIAAVKAGQESRLVDRAARNYITKRGFGKYFIHTTGHGVGRKVHEAPKISRKNKNRLRAGQVITIEPGIYIKGWGGVRIEDMVLVTKKGCKVLT